MQPLSHRVRTALTLARWPSLAINYTCIHVPYIPATDKAVFICSKWLNSRMVKRLSRFTINLHLEKKKYCRCFDIILLYSQLKHWQSSFWTQVCTRWPSFMQKPYWNVDYIAGLLIPAHLWCHIQLYSSRTKTGEIKLTVAAASDLTTILTNYILWTAVLILIVEGASLYWGG